MRLIDADALIEKRWTVDCLEVVWVKDVDGAPTIDMPQWIPCSERLPDKDVEVLVVDYNGTMQVCSVTTYKGTPVWEDVYGYWHGIEVFDAWMPLPTPWKGADDD